MALRLVGPDKTFAWDEVITHNKEGDAWIVIDSFVYDISKFAKFHPGGRAIILEYAGKDATQAFREYHNPFVQAKYHDKFCIGTLVEADLPAERPIRMNPDSFGDLIPYGDPAWYQRFTRSPYYTESHKAWRVKMRDWVETHLIPLIPEIADNKVKVPPADLMRSFGATGALAVLSGQPYPTEYAPCPPPEGCNYFHELITIDEVSRCGASPAIAGLTNGPAIALSAVRAFGTPEQQRMACPPVLAGDAFIALAISEPYAGSDVAGLRCTARREGNAYVINGNKKWITNGTYANWFVTAVRTGGPGQAGLSFLLIPRDTVGLTVRKLNIRSSDMSGTAYLDFDNAVVPVSCLIGKEGDAFKMIMHNFNHERWYLVAMVVRLCRIIIEECIRYASRRRTFGRALHEHQAVRLKIATMARQVEALSHWLEAVTHQLVVMPPREAMLALGDVICLMKAHASKVYEQVASLSTHVFGGAALYMDGVGKAVEPAQMAVKGYSIPGGAEDIMEDFAARQAFRAAAALAKL